MSKKVMKKSLAIQASASDRPVRDRREPPAKRRKRDAEKAVEEAQEFFERQRVLTFVLISGGSYALGPDLTSAIELAICHAIGRGYVGPYPAPEYEAQMPDALKRRAEIVGAVKKQVRQLRKSGASFAVVWQAVGESELHFDYAGYSEDEAREAISDLLQSELAGVLRL